ncbi:MAG: archease [Candidatus Aenigmatarchaeota archaeon]
MEKFKVLDFATADIAYEVYGKSLEELFKNAALAMFETMTDISKIEKKEVREVEIVSQDLESLLFDWLTNLLVFVDSENLFFSDFEIKIENNKLYAKCYGEFFNPEKHERRISVKAVTYHKMKIEKNDIWKATIIFDV